MSEQKLSVLIEKTGNSAESVQLLKKLNIEIDLGSVLIYFKLSLT